MTRIHQLSTLLINQIAAGEVIERPASVVKELVENAVDAGATRIEIQIEEGGAQLIRVSDNGSGILPEELPLAVAPHATSKLRETTDLDAIVTMGFRGEALASIASISRLKIMSRPTLDSGPAEAGAFLEVSGADVGPITPCAAAPGTVIQVRDLFFNTPARRKFMRGAPTEFGHIAEIIDRIAMAHPAIGFLLTHNGRKTLDLPADQPHRLRCVAILGKELDAALLEFDHADPIEKGGAQIWGLAGLPQIARPTAKFQYLYLNARPIKDRSLSHAMKEAYRGLIPPDVQPVVVAFISLNPELVDVNVHPAKSEVRFREAGRVHGLVLSAIRQRLLAADLTPRATFGQSNQSGQGFLRPGQAPVTPATPEPGFAASSQGALHAGSQGSYQPPAFPPPGELSDGQHGPPWAPTSHQQGQQSGQQPDQQFGQHSGHHQGQSSGLSPASSRAFVDYFKRMDPSQKGFVYQQVKEAMSGAQNADQPAGADDGPTLPGLGQHPQPTGQQANDGQTAAGLAGGLGAGLSSTIGAHPADSTVAPVLRTMGVLQVHKSYLVTQDEQGLLIIDQHALHERVMFEELSQRILSGNLESQRLLMPGVIRAGARRQNVCEQMQPLLEKLGIEVEPLGPDALGIQAFPSFLFERGVTPEPFMNEVLDKAEEGTLDITSPTARESVLHKVLDMMACKAAVKAGDKMTPEELAALLAKRDQIERSSNCPHGRPTTIRLTLRDLEKQFKRG